jgi:transmembrane sensor
VSPSTADLDLRAAPDAAAAPGSPASTAPATTARSAARRDLEHVLTLLARRAGGDPAAAADADVALARWRRAAPAREAGVAEAERRWALVGIAAGALAAQAGDRTRRNRRAALRHGAAGVAGALALLVGGRAGWQWRRAQPLFERRYATGHAQLLLGIELPDGSRIDLDADSALAVRHDRTLRRVDFAHGQARFDVARDVDRPFRVVARGAELTVLGTVFDVTDRAGVLSVTVEHGEVAVRTATSVHVLHAGERFEAGADGTAAVRAVQTAQLGAWRRGWLVFDATPLAQAAAAFDAYARTRFVVAPEAAALRVSGGFPARDAAGFAQVLPQVLPVRVVADGDALHIVRRAPGETVATQPGARVATAATRHAGAPQLFTPPRLLP